MGTTSRLTPDCLTAPNGAAALEITEHAGLHGSTRTNGGGPLALTTNHAYYGSCRRMSCPCEARGADPAAVVGLHILVEDPLSVSEDLINDNDVRLACSAFAQAHQQSSSGPDRGQIER